ncbi:putative multidrug-efflux transporter [Nymphon striatum]|nr:putative multidrug-efflux transporter [Nymphon striatum]
MIGFIAASIACAAAPSMAFLIAGRIAQGVAAGGVLGSAISSIGLAYEEPLRPRAYAAISAVWGVMGIGGPAVAAGWFDQCVRLAVAVHSTRQRHLPQWGAEPAAIQHAACIPTCDCPGSPGPDDRIPSGGHDPAYAAEASAVALSRRRSTGTNVTAYALVPSHRCLTSPLHGSGPPARPQVRHSLDWGSNDFVFFFGRN